MAEFPAHLFAMDGDPSAIRSSASRWQGFGTAATQASAQIKALDTHQFVGPEGDLFREGLHADMPRHLAITGDAFETVACALAVFADALAGLQDHMRPVAQRAPALWAALQAAQSRAEGAAAADAARERGLAALPAGAPASADGYRSDTDPATAALSQAQRDWDTCVAHAADLRARLSNAVRDCVRAVNEAKGMRFKEYPKGWGLLGGARDLVRDHRDALQNLSAALKAVSLVAGLLSFIPVLAPVMAQIALGERRLGPYGASLFGHRAEPGPGGLPPILTVLVDARLALLPAELKIDDGHGFLEPHSETIVGAARRFDLDPHALAALLIQEGRGRMAVASLSLGIFRSLEMHGLARRPGSTGTYGIGQMRPDVARRLARKYFNVELTDEDARWVLAGDDRASIYLAAANLRDIQDRHGIPTERAYTAYAASEELTQAWLAGDTHNTNVQNLHDRAAGYDDRYRAARQIAGLTQMASDDNPTKPVAPLRPVESPQPRPIPPSGR